MTGEKQTRRETQDIAWAAIDFDEKATWEERCLAVLQANPGGLTDWHLERLMKTTHQNASARRRNLVKDGKVRWSGLWASIPEAPRPKRIWVVGEDTPEERAGTRRWPLMYTTVRLAVDDRTALGGERLDIRMENATDALRSVARGNNAELKAKLLDIAALCFTAVEQIDSLGA